MFVNVTTPCDFTFNINEINRDKFNNLLIIHFFQLDIPHHKLSNFLIKCFSFTKDAK